MGHEILLVIPDPKLTHHTRPLREKYYIFALSYFSFFIYDIYALGPSAGGVAIATTCFGATPTDPNFLTYVGKVTYFFTGASLTIGIGQFI